MGRTPSSRAPEGVSIRYSPLCSAEDTLDGSTCPSMSRKVSSSDIPDEHRKKSSCGSQQSRRHIRIQELRAWGGGMQRPRLHRVCEEAYDNRGNNVASWLSPHRPVAATQPLATHRRADRRSGARESEEQAEVSASRGDEKEASPCLVTRLSLPLLHFFDEPRRKPRLSTRGARAGDSQGRGREGGGGMIPAC